LDFAVETTKLAKQQILSQASAQMVGNAARSTDLAKKIIGLGE
jgi:flagellin-like hook-associated protein FlgL